MDGAAGANEGPPEGDSLPFVGGTVSTVLHCGHEARRPAADAGTLSERPQPLQGNSMDAFAESEPGGEELMR
jgi:hypothetical protein